MNITRRQMAALFRDVREEHGLDIDEIRAAVVKAGLADKPITEFSLIDLCDLHQACRDVSDARNAVDPMETGMALAHGLDTALGRLLGFIEGFKKGAAGGVKCRS